MNLLFVCSENRLRSPTAEKVFGEYAGVDAIGAGTNKDAPTPVSGDLIEWADVVFVMEKSHRNKVSRRYRELLRGKKLAVLDIRDIYDYMEPVLIELLKTRVSHHLRIQR